MKLLTAYTPSRPSKPGRARRYAHPNAKLLRRELVGSSSSMAVGRGIRTSKRVVTANRNVPMSMINTTPRPAVAISAAARIGASTRPTDSPACTRPLALPRWRFGTSRGTAAE